MGLRYYCNNESCDHISKEILYKCPSCKNFGQFEEREVEDLEELAAKPVFAETVMRASDVEIVGYERLDLLDEGLNRVLGGGMVTASTALLAGPPGCGKSTLLLGVAGRLARRGKTVLYFHLEEPRQALILRLERLNMGFRHVDNLLLSASYMIESIVDQIEQYQPDLVILDSISKVQMDIPAGRLTQMKKSTAVLTKKSHQLMVPILLVGHVTSAGDIAGPKELEHDVDTVLLLGQEQSQNIRLLGVEKNRNGSSDESAFYHMTKRGLTEVDDATTFLLERTFDRPGVALASEVQGTQSFILEIQCLITIGLGERIASGIDKKRLKILCAVANSTKKIPLSDISDVYVDVTGGVTISDRSADLAWIAVMYSQIAEIIIPGTMMIMGEVNLSGGIKGIKEPLQRVMQAKKIGVTHVVLPWTSAPMCQDVEGVELIGLKDIDQLFKLLDALAE